MTLDPSSIFHCNIFPKKNGTIIFLFKWRVSSFYEYEKFLNFRFSNNFNFFLKYTYLLIGFIYLIFYHS